jgi:hypothetical protein
VYFAKIRIKVAKQEHSKKIVDNLKSQHEAKAANFLSHVMEQEIRIREFKSASAGRNFEKSENWRRKVEGINRK